jgi:putative ABC transport system ATP-binding protein
MIQIKNVTKIYGVGKDNEFKALKNISFSVEESEFVAIMGPSGSGKSTLMHIIGCLDTPTNGEYYLDSKNISTLNDDELSEIRRDKIGFVFQSFNLLPRTSVLRNTMLPLMYKNQTNDEREEKAKNSLRASSLDEVYFNHKSNELSGGQIQRVAIARALVNDPKIILADEPTGNLDTKTGEIVLGTFQKLNEEFGSTIILITHELDVAMHAKRIITIRDGNIVSDEINKNQKLV